MSSLTGSPQQSTLLYHWNRMFRLVNTSQGLRPALISKFKHAKTGGTNPSPFSTTTTNAPTNTTPTSNSKYESTFQFKRAQSTVAPPATVATTIQTPSSQNAAANPYRSKLDSFSRIYHVPNHVVGRRTEKIDHTATDEMATLILDENFRNQMTETDLYRYAASIYSAAIAVRRQRLEMSRNRDRDNAASFGDDLKYQSAAIALAESIAAGEFPQQVSARTLFKVFATLMQFKLNDEIMNLWETGVAQSEGEDLGDIGKMYLDHTVLSVVLEVAYDSKRFSYEEILRIYEMSLVENEPIHPYLLERIGQIAIKHGDHARGLDCLEQLMNNYENNPRARSILGALSQIHIAFIGNCKDTIIAKRFFEKAVDESDHLPYTILLKAPYVVSFLQNCNALGDSFENIVDMWSRVCQFYIKRREEQPSRMVTINSGLFKILFDKYPEPSMEAMKLMKLTFAKCKNINEHFLNTLISHMPWKDRTLVNDVVSAYDKFKVPKSVVSHRIILKNAGNVEYTPEEILTLWNQLLLKLDSEGYKYIANADWAAIRLATIFSEQFKSPERDCLYYSIVRTYKNYMQHDEAALRFLRATVRDATVYKQISRITTEENPTFEINYDIEVPEFKNLKENTNYPKVTKKVTDANPNLL